jgi:hypothetical protein
VDLLDSLSRTGSKMNYQMIMKELYNGLCYQIYYQTHNEIDNEMLILSTSVRVNSSYRL